MSALSKAELAEDIVNTTSFARSEAKEFVEHFFEILRQTLESGDGVKLSGFGNFVLRDKPQRPGRNPKTGEEIPVLARRVVTFKAGLKLKKIIEEKVL